jgi:ATP-dependent exoDNAse (exonuclease V) beta subunit
LHCLGALQFKDGELVAGKRSALQLLWPAIEVDAVASWHANGSDAVAAGAKAKTVERSVGRSLRRLPAARVRTVWPKNIATARLPVSSGELVGERVLDFAVASELARAAGVVVHRELERWGGRASLPTAEQIQERSAAYAAALRAEGVSRAELAAGVSRVIGALQRTVSDERGRWILSRHVEDHFELALTGSYEGVISSIVIDRSFVHEGVRWVIDYKTSAHEGANLEAFLDAQRERYAAQLRRYAEFARHLGPEPVRTALYFPLLGAFVEIADASC